MARERGRGGAAVRGQLLRLAVVVPGIVMAVSLLGLLVFCRALLAAAADGRSPDATGPGFWLAAGGFFAAAGVVVVVQAVRIANRVAGPEARLQDALQRIREGDVGFRVTLRRGDLLTGLARECNELLDWLNVNPPRGARTGSDVVALEAVPGERP